MSKLITCSPREATSRSKGTPKSRLAPSPVIISTGGPEPRTDVRSRTPLTSTNRVVADLRERAHTRDVPSHDQGLDGLGALIGVNRLDVGHVPHDMEVEQNAVATEQVPCLGYDVPGLSGAFHLCDRSDGVGHPALFDEPGQPQAVQLHRADLREHLH